MLRGRVLCCAVLSQAVLPMWNGVCGVVPRNEVHCRDAHEVHVCKHERVCRRACACACVRVRARSTCSAWECEGCLLALNIATKQYAHRAAPVVPPQKKAHALE